MKEELVDLKTFADMHGLVRDTVKHNCQRGKYKSARKLGNQWVIDKNEPHTDNRITSGKYVKKKD